jgi:hypothetical protein
MGHLPDHNIIMNDQPESKKVRVTPGALGQVTSYINGIPKTTQRNLSPLDLTGMNELEMDLH